MLPPSIATAALLKAQLDRGSDYFDLLTPFVEEALAGEANDIVAPEKLRDTLERHSGLRVALRTIVVLLDRLAKRDGSAIRKEGVSFVRTGLAITPRSPAKDLTSQFEALGESFQMFVSDRVLAIKDSSSALEIIVSFLEKHSVTLVLDGVAPDVRTGRKEDLAVAQFVTQSLSSDSANAVAILALLQGLVLARAVTLEDLAGVERKLKNLQVYFDTSFVLAAAGLYGNTDLEAARDAIRILRELGATPAVFDATVAEVRQVLAVYENKLETSRGRAELYRTPLTSYFLSQNARGTDARTASELLERTLGAEGLTVHNTPPREARYVSDEVGLATALSDVRGAGHEAREKHDLDCIAAILTLRRGSRPQRIEDARAIFAASGMVVRVTQRWWSMGNEHAIAPIIDHAALLNYCWLKRPSVAPSLHRFELAALCASTLSPSDEAWAAFKAELHKFVSDGRISSSDEAVILIDSFSQKVLIEAEATDSISPESAAHLVDLVREELRREVDAAKAETAREREANESALSEVRRKHDGALLFQARSFEDQLAALSRTLEEERSTRIALENSVSGLARLLSKFVAVPLASLLVAFTAAAVIFPIVGDFDLPRWAQFVLKAFAVVVGIAGGAFGISALSLGQRIQLAIENRLRKSLTRESTRYPER